MKDAIGEKMEYYVVESPEGVVALFNSLEDATAFFKEKGLSKDYQINYRSIS